jgi:hypothetical protein
VCASLAPSLAAYEFLPLFPQRARKVGGNERHARRTLVGTYDTATIFRHSCTVLCPLPADLLSLPAITIHNRSFLFRPRFPHDESGGSRTSGCTYNKPTPANITVNFVLPASFINCHGLLAEVSLSHSFVGTHESDHTGFEVRFFPQMGRGYWTITYYVTRPYGGGLRVSTKRAPDCPGYPGPAHLHPDLHPTCEGEGDFHALSGISPMTVGRGSPGVRPGDVAEPTDIHHDTLTG